MSKMIDMTGWVMKEHGVPDSKLTVIKRVANKNGKTYWTCKCECGTIKDIRGTCLRSGQVKSCGCLLHNKTSSPSTLIDETNNRYGRLIVISKAGTAKGGAAQWLCKCDCGKEVIVRGDQLRSGNTQSCGCLNKEKVREQSFIDLTGQVFGLLTVIQEYPIRTKDNKIQWNCRCACGKEKIIRGASLISEATQSCGCLSMSHGEFKIKEILTDNNIKFIQEYKPNAVDLFKEARYDFYIPSLNVLIEFDGKQHFKPEEFFGGEQKFITTKAHDKEKNEWAHAHGIQIIRIPYTHYDELCIKDLMSETSDFILHKKIKYISRQR